MCTDPQRLPEIELFKEETQGEDGDEINGRAASPGTNTGSYGMLPWIVLCLSCLVTIAPYYIYDSLASCEEGIESDLHVTPSQFSFLFSLYAIPNVVLVLIGGAFVDKLGIGPVLIFTSILMCGGGILIALAGWLRAWWLMGVGMVLYGAGSECVQNASEAMVVYWFGSLSGGKWMGFANGILGVAEGLGNLLAYGLNGDIMQAWSDYRAVLSFGAVLSIIALVASAVYFILEKRLESRSKLAFQNTGHGHSVLSWKLIKEFSTPYWVATAATTTYAVTEGLFWAHATAQLQESGYKEGDAKMLMTGITLGGIILSPPMGALFDRLGGRHLAVIFSFIASGCIYLSLALPHPNVGVVLVLLSFVQNIIENTMWAWYYLTIPVPVLGLGLGIEDAIYNMINVAVFPLMGLISDSGPGRSGPIIYCVTSLFTAALSWYWHHVEVQHVRRVASTDITQAQHEMQEELLPHEARS